MSEDGPQYVFLDPGFGLLRGRDSGFEGRVIARLGIVVVNGTRDLAKSGNIAFFNMSTEIYAPKRFTAPDYLKSYVLTNLGKSGENIKQSSLYKKSEIPNQNDSILLYKLFISSTALTSESIKWQTKGRNRRGRGRFRSGLPVRKDYSIQ